MPTTSSPATAMRYRDIAAAANWLCEAFGFEKQTALTDPAGATMYAQLTFGRALIMLAPVGNSPIEKFMKQPDEIGGAETQSCYFVVPDADAHHAKAKAAGAEIVLPVEDDGFGGRGYTCRDPEGHIWTFGTYDPWQGKFPEPAAPPAAPSRGRRFVLATLTAVALVAVAVAAWFGGALTQSSAVSPTAQITKAAAAANTAALEAADQAAREVRAQLDRERTARASADKASEEALKRAAEAQQAREAAERAVKEARIELDRERKTRTAPPPDLMKRIEEESRAREAAERAVKEARADLDRERKAKAAPPPDLMKRIEEESRAREAAERAVKEARAELERARRVSAEAPAADGAKRLEEAERRVKEARAEVEKVRNDKIAAEMAKEFALGRAEEEQAAREAAERAAQEARAALERKQANPAAADAKALADVRRALDEAKKRGADEQRAREAAELAAKEAREQLAKEQTARAAAWKVVGQLTKQLKQAKSGAPSEVSGADDADSPAPKKAKARPRPKKAADDGPEQ